MSDPRPIIVGGCYRSGTSLVRRLLDAHPDVHCGPEVKLFSDLYGTYLDVDDPIAHLRFLTTARSLVPEGDLLEVLGGGLVEMHERAARRAGKRRWADKAPENVVYLDHWQRLLGDEWVFLHVVRNPLDTLASIEEQGFPRSIPNALGARIDLYLDYAEAGLRFGEQNPDRYIRLLYEDLVTEPEKTTRKLMERLGESFHPEQLAINSSPHQKGLEDPKASRASTVHRDSIDRWPQILSRQDAEEITRRTESIWARFDVDGSYRMSALQE